MVQETREITKEDYEKGQKEGAKSLITDPAMLCGYGVYGAWVDYDEEKGKYYLRFWRGDSCD